MGIYVCGHGPNIEVGDNLMSKNNPSELVRSLRRRVGKTRGKSATRTIVMFDLVGSTSLKLKKGHTVGTRTALLHNLICKEIAAKHKGFVFKELGDGLLIAFNDPVSACWAAVDIKTATFDEESVLTKGSIAIGSVEEIEISGRRDLIGSAIDRCSRINSSAAPGQILLDGAVYSIVSSILKDHKNICVGSPRTLDLRGVGPHTIYEISTKKLGLIGFQRIPFIIHEDGRLGIKEKVEFMEGANCEIIELGVGLTTFTEYFRSRRRNEFKDHVMKLLKSGVVLRCMLLDPDSDIAKAYARDLGESTLLNDIRSSIQQLKTQQKQFEGLNLKGQFEIYAYEHVPYFHAVCVDPETDYGRLTVSHYIHGISRANAPVAQFSRASNDKMFDKYWLSIKELLMRSRLL